MANLLTRFFGRTASEGAAFALGVATGPVLYPAVREIEQEANKLYPSASLETGDAAEIVAEDVDQLSWGEGEAALHGLNAQRFDLLVKAALNAPDFGTVLQLRRRGLVSEETFHHALRKARLEDQWDDSLLALTDVLLTVADLANAVVQGHMPQDAAATEAAKQGVSAERFDVLVQNTGLPPGPETLLAWLRRGIITQAEFEQGVREGHTKTKYIPFYEAAISPVLHPATYAGLWLRGWITQQEAEAGGALSGYTAEQMRLEYLNRGRPATAHQIHIGYARGAKLDGAANEEEAIRTSVHQSDIRSEYADLIIAARYAYPPFFALRTLAQSQVITEQEMRQVLLYEGWEPSFAEKVAAFYAKPAATTATENPYVAKADSQLWTAIHKAYVKTGVTRAEAETPLAVLVPEASVRDTVFARWDAEKAIAAVQPPAA